MFDLHQGYSIHVHFSRINRDIYSFLGKSFYIRINTQSLADVKAGNSAKNGNSFFSLIDIMVKLLW